ncbi:MAG: methyltransferase [Deltaproteobacteria bacterium RBG_13_49_15]|nr:MAG: methyltransferase [Deltaproteobacteria bacterium RBG_13_49_15]
MKDYLAAIKEAVIFGKHKEIEDLVGRAIEENVDLEAIINNGMIAAMDVVGEMFTESRIFVPEMLVSAMTMKKGLNLVKPLLKGKERRSKGTVMMCTVRGDIHDIGKNLVIMMLEGAGFDVIDLGVDLDVEKLIDQAERVRPQILGLSALLTTTMPEMKKVIEVLKEKGLRAKLKVMIGGAPVDSVFAKEIGADGYGKDTSDAVQLARSFVSKP